MRVIRMVEEVTGIRAAAAQANLLDGWSHVATALVATEHKRGEVEDQLDRAEEHFRRAMSEQTTTLASHRLADLASRWDEYMRINPDDAATLRVREHVRAMIDESRRLAIGASNWSDALEASRLAIDAMIAIEKLDGQLGERVEAETPRDSRKPHRQQARTAPDVDLLQPPANSRPAADGRAIRRLDFSGLDPEGFERLIFSLIASDEAWVNPRWLTHTNAPDRGRDLSVERIVTDGLLGSRRERVFVQCRHTSVSLSANDVEKAATPLRLWEPPPVDVLVIATSARFTTDALQWIDSFNQEGRTEIIPWANSHLELLLAGRPQIVDDFGLAAE
jgi:hypothetical protein